jgi:hypothetical protein
MRRPSVALLVVLAVAACKKAEPPPPQPEQPAGSPAAAAQPGAPAQPDAAGMAAVSGTILERIDDAPPYSYLRLKTDKGETWAAVPKTDAAKGAKVTVLVSTAMPNFESPKLKRKFEVVYFGQLAGQDGAAAAAPAGMPPPMGGGMGGPQQMDPNAMRAQHAAAAAGPAEVGDVKVAKATGANARSIAEIWAQRTALAEKPVVVRGKVVKYNGGIMGKNWLHLRDGTGAAGKDNDITVTTSDTAAVGDVVTVKGTVRIDKDFGSGYAYPVIVEEAKLSK